MHVYHNPLRDILWAQDALFAISQTGSMRSYVDMFDKAISSLDFAIPEKLKKAILLHHMRAPEKRRIMTFAGVFKTSSRLANSRSIRVVVQSWTRRAPAVQS